MSTPALQQKVLDLVQVMGVIMEKAAEEHANREAEKVACAALIPEATQALLVNEKIEPHQEKQAMQVLADPPTVLRILIKTAHHRNPNDAAPVGRPVTPQGQVKKAGSNNMGRRPSGEIDNATLAMKARLGLA